VNRLRTGRSGVRIPVSAIYCPLHQSVQIKFGTYGVSNLIISIVLLETKLPGREANHISPSGAKVNYKGADKSLARPGRKQATATEDFDVLFIIIIGGILVLFMYI